MVVGCLEVAFEIPGVQSLKEKRRVVKRCVERVKNRYNVAVAEVGDNDLHGRALVGITTVANDSGFVSSVLDKVIDFLETDLVGLADIVDTRIEVVRF